jgi:O-methyltransferase
MKDYFIFHIFGGRVIKMIRTVIRKVLNRMPYVSYLYSLTKKLREETAALSFELVKTKENVSILQKERESLQEENAVLQKERGSLQEENAVLQKERGSLQEENAVLQKERGSLQEENTVLQKERAHFSNLYSSVLNEKKRIDQEQTALMMRDTWHIGLRKSFLETNDPVRYASIYLAINRIMEEKIEGDFAELGVWKGYTAKIINRQIKNRKFYLFDTFEGFPKKDVQSSVQFNNDVDSYFQDTSVEEVVSYLENPGNIVVRKGYFPETAAGLENCSFAFAMIDADLYTPILEGLRFFYPRVVSGGYIFVHDYNLPVFDWGGKKAVDEFMADKPELIVEIPDGYGSVIIRKK